MKMKLFASKNYNILSDFKHDSSECRPHVEMIVILKTSIKCCNGLI